MTSSSKDRGSNSRDDCQIHVDKEGESCVIKIESVGQEKMLKELLDRFNSLKTEVNQFLSGQQKQQRPKEMLDAIQDMTSKLKPLEDQLQKINKNIGDDHIQLNKLYTDLNKKFDEIKQDLNSFKEQQKNIGSSKDVIDKILQKLDNLDKILKNSQDEGQKRLSLDLQNLKQQIPLKNDFKPVLDAIQALQSSFDKEKTKPDILARKLDSIDQKLKDSHPEHMTALKDIQTKIDPLHKTTSQTSETLIKINDRVKAMHADTAKSHPDIIQKLDNIDQHLKNQQNSFIEPMKKILNEKLNPFIEQTKKDGEEKLGKIYNITPYLSGSPNITERDNDSPNSVPLCINGMIPVLCKLSDPHVLQALAGDIAKKLADIQTKMSSPEDLKRKQDDFIGNLTKQQTPLIDEIKRLTPILDKLKQQQQKDSENFNRDFEKSFQPITQKLNDLTKQQDLLKNIDSKLNQLSQNIDKENDFKKQDIGKEISTRTQPIQQAIENLSKQQQPLIEIIRELPKKLDPLTQAIKDGLDHQTQNKDQTLMNIDKKLNQDIDKALQPFSQIIKTLKDNIEQSQAETKKLDNLEQRLSKSFDTTSKTSDIMGKLNEITTNLKQTDPNIKKLSDEIGTIKILMEKQITPDDILSKINEITQKQKAPLEAALKDIHSKIEPLQIDKIIDPLNKVNDQIRHITDKIDQIQPKNNDENSSQKLSPDLINTLKKLDNQLTHLNNNLPAMGDIPKQIGSLKDAFDKFKQNENNNESSHAIKDINDRLKSLDETMKGLPDQISSKSKRLDHDDEKTNMNNLRQVPLSQSIRQDSNNSMATPDGQIANLFTNLLTLQTAIQNSDHISYQDIQQYLKRIEQSSLVQTDRDLQGLVQRVKDLSLNKNKNTKSNLNIQNSDRNKNPNNVQSSDPDKNSTTSDSSMQSSDPKKNSSTSNSNVQNSDRNKNPTTTNSNIQSFDPPTNRISPIQQYSEIDNSKNRRNENKISLPQGYLTKSRYISLLSNQTIRDNWPKLSSRSTPIIESIINQPIEFDNGTNIDRLIKQNGLEQYALLTRNAIEKSDKDYDKISYMMDSIVFDQMTMIGSREAIIRPWNPSLLNRASSKGPYPYPAGDDREIERFKVNKDISLWMVETDESKPYKPTEFMPNIGRLNEKYEKIQQPQFKEIRQKRREDETRWNERYAFTKDNRTILFVNDLRSYFMDYDTKRKYQVHDDVPINPVCRTGIAGRGDLPFWGPNHCVVVVLLRNINEPEVVLMRHHDDALVLPKGFYGHEARYDNQIKIIQDPVSGQILPPNLFNYWWSNIVKLNEINNSITNLKRVLNDKELKEEFAEIFSQKGCNKSVFDNGYVDHPLNTDHAWIESSVWKIQFKDWRIPEMKSAKYSIADDLKNNNNKFPFIWMKLIDAILIVPPFDRGILVDVLATGMPL